MAKAIYANIAGIYYQINQPTRVPSEMIRMPSTHSTLTHDVRDRSFTASIWLSGLDGSRLQTNRGIYNDMVEDLRERLTTEVPVISDQYLIYVDYSIYNEHDEEINHSCTTKRVPATDALLALGVAFNNECVYRRVKSFNPKIVFSVTNRVPFGVMQSAYGKRYQMKINDICILQSIDPLKQECFNDHGSIEENSFDFQSHTIHTLMQDHIPVYSSAASNIDLGTFEVSFYPRKITIDLHCVLANLIVAYDDQTIKDILTENMEIKYNPDKPVSPDPGGPGETPDDPIIPPDDPKEDADGKYEPDENGFYYYYERCTETNPTALLVVEDNIPDNVYDPDTMIRVASVLQDIDDIRVGEYVRLTTGFDITNL